MKQVLSVPRDVSAAPLRRGKRGVRRRGARALRKEQPPEGGAPRGAPSRGRLSSQALMIPCAQSEASSCHYVPGVSEAQRARKQWPRERFNSGSSVGLLRSGGAERLSEAARPWRGRPAAPRSRRWVPDGRARHTHSAGPRPGDPHSGSCPLAWRVPTRSRPGVAAAPRPAPRSRCAGGPAAPPPPSQTPPTRRRGGFAATVLASGAQRLARRARCALVPARNSEPTRLGGRRRRGRAGVAPGAGPSRAERGRPPPPFLPGSTLVVKLKECSQKRGGETRGDAARPPSPGAPRPAPLSRACRARWVRATWAPT